MTDHRDQFREAFEAHEDLAPDPAVVYARVQELSRSYMWRRRGAQVAGGAVLGVGLIAGAITLPGLLPGSPDTSTSAFVPAAAPAVSPSLSAAPAPSVSSSTLPSDVELEKLWDAYFAAGYDYDDALKLADLWNSKDEVGAVKAEAGRRLLAGETLPIKPSPNQPSPEGSGDPDASAALAAYFNAGYDWADAEKLADLWKLDDPSQAKVDAGKKILAGETLPIKP